MKRIMAAKNIIVTHSCNVQSLKEKHFQCYSIIFELVQMYVTGNLNYIIW